MVACWYRVEERFLPLMKHLLSPLTYVLQSRRITRTVVGATLAEEALQDPIPQKRVQASKKRISLGWDGSWYEDEDRKRTHRDLVLAGMEKARLQGKRIGRPKVIEQEGFLQRFQMVVSRIGEGGISRRQAAAKLNIGYATLKRLLDAQLDSSDEERDNDSQHSLPSHPAGEERLIMACH
jgi:hypothetical protein